jgi:hypothetical protein
MTVQVALNIPEASLEQLAHAVALELAHDLIVSESAKSPWLDVDAAATHLGATTPDAVRALVKRRQIPFHKAPNGRLLFDRHELDAWVRGESG